jgi:hypothetical protein
MMMQYSLLGGEGESAGLLPRFCQDLFAHIASVSSAEAKGAGASPFTVTFSALELSYMGVRSLLDAPTDQVKWTTKITAREGVFEICARLRFGW